MAEGGQPKLQCDKSSRHSDGSQHEIFEKAANYLPSLMAKLDQTQLISLYAHYKQATEGTCTTPKPGFFDYKGKQKWNAWSELGDMSKEDAMRQYIKTIKSIDPDWDQQSEEHNSTQNKSVGPVMSVMVNNERALSDNEKTIFDLVKEDAIDRLEVLAKNKQLSEINQKDEDGLALVHWASDRGHVNMVKWLVNHNADVNITDLEGQTALHYASSCGHLGVVKVLLEKGALPSIRDKEGLLPKDVSLNESISQAFSNCS